MRVVRPRYVSLFLLSTLFFFSSSVRAQRSEPVGSSTLPERSTAFAPLLEVRIEKSLDRFRTERFEAEAASSLANIVHTYRSEYSAEEELLSLDLFRSLAAYYRERALIAQGIDDDVLENAEPASRIATETSLLSALEFYAHSPLRRIDVEAGLARLNAIVDPGAASAAVKPEIEFWKAEGFQALGQYAQAEQLYRASILNASNEQVAALASFRLAELVERKSRFAEADTLFAHVIANESSPLQLIAMVRRAAVLRSQGRYEEVLRQLEESDSLYSNSSLDVRTSAREFRYSSPLVERLLLKTTEEDRLVGSAPLRATPRRSEVATKQLTSGHYPAEAALLRGSALSELGRYEDATRILTAGEETLERSRDSVGGAFSAQELFYSNALKFERAWSLFQRQKYQDAATAFLQLASEDTASRHLIVRSSALPLREQGRYYDPFINDTVLATAPSELQPGVLGRTTVDTSFFFYNDFPERARFYAGVALERAGLRKEAADVFTRLTVDKSVLYSTQANYQLALIRFLEGNYQAQQLLEPLSYERSLTGAYSSFLLGELAYRRQLYERAERYFFNSYANLPLTDTEVLATAHLERGLSLIPLKSWQEASDELSTYFQLTQEHIPGKTDEALYWLGKSYFRIAQYDSAKTLLRRLLTDYPKSTRLVDAQYLYAWSLFSQNDFAAAEPEFERVVTMDSIYRYSYDVLARAGDSYYGLGDLVSASKIYNQAIDRPAFNDLRSTRALIMLGVTRMRLDSNRSAMNLFHYVTTKYPSSDIVDEATFNEALAAYAISQNAQAEQLVQKIVSQYKRSPAASRALLVAGEERSRTNDPAGAAQYYRQVVTEYANSPQAEPALFAMQDALLALSRPQEALAAGDTFIVRNPTSPLNHEIMFRSGELRLRLGLAAEAMSTYKSFIAQFPDDDLRPAAEVGLGRALLLTGDTAKALAQFTTVVRDFDSTSAAPQALLERARVERAQLNYVEAAQDFQAAYATRFYSTDPAPQAMWEFAQMLAEQNRPDSAILLLRDLSTRYPIQVSLPARAAIRSAELLHAAKRDAEAFTELDRVTTAHAGDALGGAAMVRLATLRLDNEQWSKAAEAAVAARRDYSVGAESEAKRTFALGVAHFHLGRKSEALAELRRAVGLKTLSIADRETANRLIAELTPKKQPAEKTPKEKKPATKKPAPKKKGAHG